MKDVRNVSLVLYVCACVYQPVLDFKKRNDTGEKKNRNEKKLLAISGVDK